MTKPFAPSVVTANDLLVGDVIYQTQSGWTRELAQASVLTNKEAADRALAAATDQLDIAVSPYLAEICQTIDGPIARHFREEFRATGPSNYPHGKQEEGQSHV